MSWPLRFKLTQDGDKLYGRGTTDCLGHVALITTLLQFLAGEYKNHGKDDLKLDFNLVVVFIAAEVGGELGVGVDVMVKNGQLEVSRMDVMVKNGQLEVSQQQSLVYV